jgi:hypothetical protein
VFQETETLVPEQVSDVVNTAGEQVVQADDLVARLQEMVAEMTAEKSGPARNDHSHDPSRL